MALQQYPSFTFNEKVVGPRPTRSFTVDVAGVVGQFARAFQDVAFACDSTEAFKRFGRRGQLNGDVGVQAIQAQGADQFLISAVHGLAKKASVDVSLKGAVTAGTPTGNVQLVITDARPGAVQTSKTFTVAIVAAMTAKQALTDLAALINQAYNSADDTALSGSAILGATVTGDDNDAVLTLTMDTVGVLPTTSATGVAAALTASTAVGYFTSAAPATATAGVLTGGYDAPAYAKATLKNAANQDVIELRYLYPGKDADDNVIVRVKEGSLASKRTIEVEHTLDGILEVIKDFDADAVKDVEQGDLIVSMKGKILFSAHNIAADAVTDFLPAVTAANAPIAFAGGKDGAPVTTADYLRAIDLLETEPCTFVIAPMVNGAYPAGVDKASVETAIVAHIAKVNDELGEAYGLRMGILNAKRGLTLDEMEDQTTGIDRDDIVKVAGWVTTKFTPKLQRYGASPDSFYVGKAMRTPLQVSVAAKSSSPALQGVAEVDTPVGPKAWNKLTAHRLDALYKDPVLKVYTCLNGRTTTSSPKQCYWTCYRRVMNRVRMDIFARIYTTGSEPSDANLDDLVEHSIDNDMSSKMKSGMIRGYDPTVSDDSNNPPELRNEGHRIVDFGVELIPPNDFTEVNVTRVLKGSVRV